MRTHRGLTESTLDVYEGIVVGLLDAVGDDTASYSAETLRSFVLNRSRPHGIERAKSIVVAVRSFVRFLNVGGRCPVGLEHAIPGFASWRLSSVPRFLAAEDVERVISDFMQACRKLTISSGQVNAQTVDAYIVGAGLYQMNVTIPLTMASGDLPLRATAGGAQTPSTVVINVQ
jgi:hypothetical protein